MQFPQEIVLLPLLSDAPSRAHQRHTAGQQARAPRISGRTEALLALSESPDAEDDDDQGDLAGQRPAQEETGADRRLSPGRDPLEPRDQR